MRDFVRVFFEGVVIGITLLVVGEVLNCIIADWCITNPKRQGKNVKMFAHYILLGLITHLIYEYGGLNQAFCKMY